MSRVEFEGWIEPNNALGRTRQRVLRREAMRYARIAVTVLAALVLAAAPAVAGQITASWVDTFTPITNFNLERVGVPNVAACTPATTGFVEVARPITNVYIDTGLTNGAFYCYRVAASNLVGKSGYSGVAAAQVPVVPVPVPVPTVPVPPSGLILTPQQ